MRAAWWWIDRWRKSTARTDMDLAERGAYRELLDECWLRDGVIPDDDAILTRIVGCSPDEWRKIRVKVLARFEKCDGGLRNQTADEVRLQSKNFLRRQQEKGQISASKAKRGPGGTFARKDAPEAPNPTGNQPDHQPGIQPDHQPGVQPETNLPSPSPSQEQKQSPEPTNGRDGGTTGSNHVCEAEASPETRPERTVVNLQLVPPEPTETAAAKEVFAYWQAVTKHERAQWTPERGAVLKKRLAEEPGSMTQKVAGLKLAVDGVVVDPWFNGSENGKKLTGFLNVFQHQGRNRIERLQESARRGPEPVLDRSTRSSISALDSIGEDE